MEKKIPGFSEYSVDEQGNVYSYKSGYRLMMKPNLSQNGYLDIRLRCVTGFKVFFVHRLVADAFVPGRSEERDEVNHIDNDRTNSAASNLQWVTHTENMAHRTATGWVPPIGEQRKSQYKIIATCLKTGIKKTYHSAVVAEVDGFSRKRIYAVLKGQNKAHKGFTFKYA